MTPAVSVIIPAFNEARHIADTVHSVREALAAARVDHFEILVFDDDSTDETGRLVDDIAARFPCVRAFHNRPNRGFGYSFRRGVELAEGTYVGFVPGDNDLLPETLQAVFSALGDSDILTTYHAAMESRPWIRRVLSRLFTCLINLMFGLHLKYYNGPAFLRTELLRSTDRSAEGHGFMVEVLVQLVKAGYRYREIPMRVREQAGAKTSAFKPRNIWRLFKMIATVVRRIHVNSTPPRLRIRSQVP